MFLPEKMWLGFAMAQPVDRPDDNDDCPLISFQILVKVIQIIEVAKEKGGICI